MVLVEVDVAADADYPIQFGFDMNCPSGILVWHAEVIRYDFRMLGCLNTIRQITKCWHLVISISSSLKIHLICLIL